MARSTDSSSGRAARRGTRASGGGGARRAQRIGRRILGAVGVIALLYWVIEGGEYGTSDLVKQRVRRGALIATIDSLERDVDSLRAWSKAVRTDPRVQERIAREEFGMVRGDNEVLYRFAPADSTAP